MKRASAIAKGRRLQEWVCTKLIQYLPILKNDVINTSSGACGSDVKLSPRAELVFPYGDIECKNTERLDLWKAWDQSRRRCDPDKQSVVFVKKNGRDPLAVIDGEYFFSLHNKLLAFESVAAELENLNTKLSEEHISNEEM